MSVPQNQSGSYLSSVVLAEHFIPPDNEDYYPLLDKEKGGVALNDPSEGLRVQDWTLRYYSDTGDFVIEAPTVAATIIHNAMLVTEISLAFDQNMNPFVAYVEDGDAKFWWYDPETDSTLVTNLPAGSTTPRCCVDDKRDFASGAQVSDIILCYALNSKLYKRTERERYTVQALVKDPFLHPISKEPAGLVRVGMNEANRLQWLCFDPAMNEGWC